VHHRSSRRARTRTRLVAATFLLALSAGPAFATNGAKLTSYGVRAAGRGGVDYAFADDATAPATNPAGIAFTPNRLDQTWVAALATTTFKDVDGTYQAAPQWQIPLPAYSFGVIFDPTQTWHVGDLFDIGNWGLKPSADDPPGDGYTGSEWRSSYGDLAQAVPPDSKGSSTSGSGTSPPPQRTDTLPPAPRPTVPDADSSDEEVYGGRLRFGFGVFPVTGGTFLFRHVESPFWDPAAITYKTAGQELSIAPSIAYRILGNKSFSLSIGYSPQFHYATLQIDGPIQQPNSTLSSTFQTASALVGSNSVTTYAASHNLVTFGFSQRAGLLFVMDMFSVGVVYQDRTYLQDFLGSATVDSTQQITKLTFGNPSVLQIVNSNLNPSLGYEANYDMRVQHYQQPRDFGAGLGFRPFDRIALGVDYTYIMWAETFRVFRARLTNSSNANLNILTSQTIHVAVPLEYKNENVIAVGGSFVLLRGDDIVPDVPSFQLIWRAGYNFGQNPVPSSTVKPDTPIIYENHISTGFTFQLGPYVEFSVAAEYALPSTVHVGSSAINGDLSNSELRSSLITLFGGFGISF
jgi:long-subunit fatty acid transport protein